MALNVDSSSRVPTTVGGMSPFRNRVKTQARSLERASFKRKSRTCWPEGHSPSQTGLWVRTGAGRDCALQGPSSELKDTDKLQAPQGTPTEGKARRGCISSNRILGSSCLYFWGEATISFCWVFSHVWCGFESSLCLISRDLQSMPGSGIIS